MSSPSEMGAPHVAVTAGSHLGSPPLLVLVNFRHFSIFSKRRHEEVGSLKTPEGWCHCHVNVKYPLCLIHASKTWSWICGTLLKAMEPLESVPRL